jgi:hypothetical protein
VFRKVEDGSLRHSIEQQALISKGDNRSRILTNLIYAPTTKQSTPTIGSEFLRTKRLESTKDPQTSQQVKFCNIEDTHCYTLDSPKDELHRLPNKLKPVIMEKCNSKKSLSMFVADGKNHHSSRRHLQRYD